MLERDRERLIQIRKEVISFPWRGRAAGRHFRSTALAWRASSADALCENSSTRFGPRLRDRVCALARRDGAPVSAHDDWCSGEPALRFGRLPRRLTGSRSCRKEEPRRPAGPRKRAVWSSRVRCHADEGAAARLQLGQQETRSCSSRRYPVKDCISIFTGCGRPRAEPRSMRAALLRGTHGDRPRGLLVRKGVPFRDALAWLPRGARRRQRRGRPGSLPLST